MANKNDGASGSGFSDAAGGNTANDGEASVQDFGNEIANNNPWQVSAALQIPPFWSKRPTLWFLQVETQFRLKGITTSQTKFDYLVSSLPVESMETIADALSHPIEGDKYEIIKQLLISRSQDTEEKRLDNLLNRMEIGDSKPSELFRQMENLAVGNNLVNKKLLNKLWLNKLPASVQPCVIAIENTHSQEDVFKIADRIYDSLDRPKVSAVKATPESDLKSMLEDLSNRLRKIEVRESRSRSRGPSFRKRSISRHTSASRDTSRADWCWYHKKFSAKATKCRAVNIPQHQQKTSSTTYSRGA